MFSLTAFSFSPNDFGPRFWIQPNTLDLADGSNVGSYTDIFNRRITIVEPFGAGTGPTLKTNGLRGAKYLNFNGEGLTHSTDTVANNYTAFVVARSATPQASHPDYSSVFVWLPNIRFYWKLSNGLWGTFSGGGDASNAIGGSLNTNTWYLFTMKATPTTTQLYLNGGFYISTDGQAAMASHGIGLDDAGAGREFPGDIGDIIVYDRLLTDVEKVAVESSLKSKWGIS